MRGAVVLFAGCAALGVCLLAGGAVFERRMEREYRYHDARLQDISQRYLAVDEEERIIRDYLPRFLELDDRGLTGEEHRLNWVETLQGAGAALGLPSLGYQIRAQKPYRSRVISPPAGHEVFVSEMALSMQLLHEGDLFALLDLLDERAKGMYAVSSCELTRNFVELTDNPLTGNISADCLLEWFSIKAVADRGAGT